MNCAFQNLFDEVGHKATDDVISSVLAQIISIGVVHGEPLCRLAATVNIVCCRVIVLDVEMNYVFQNLCDRDRVRGLLNCHLLN